MMDLKKIVLFCFFSFLLFSCKRKNDMDLFEEFVHKKSASDFIVLETSEVTPMESLDKNYRRIIQDKGNTSFLLEKAKSTEKTEYCIPNLICPMTEGDIAVCMLIGMYEMSDDYFETVMYENIKRETNSARDFWDYVHASEINRTEIIQKISDWILLCKSSDLLVPWTEDEILNLSFELISDTEIENFSFSRTDEGVMITSCTYGKKDSFVTAPVEYWKIEGAYLCIYPYETVLNKKQIKIIKIGKIKIDKENKILYAYRNYRKAAYRYEKN